jgi:hypothetical protein
MAFANLSIAPLRSIIAGQFVCSNRLLRCGQKMAYSAKVSVKCCARNRYRRHSDRRRPALRGDRVRLETVDVAAVVLRGGVGELLWTGDGLGGGAESREVRGGDQAGEASRHLIYLDQCHTGCGADPRLSPNTLRVATKTRDRSHRLRPNFVDFDQVLASAVVYARKFHAIDANRRQGDE